MRIVWKTLFYPLLLLLSSAGCHAEDLLEGRVVKVSDGDSFTLLLDDETQQRVRLYGIDAPEMKSRRGHRGEGGQPYCRASKNHLSSLISGKRVRVASRGCDRYGRVLGIVSTDEVDDVNLEMIRSGMAWHYAYYDSTPAYAQAEKQARSLHLGLWKDPQPVSPYEWRKQ